MTDTEPPIRLLLAAAFVFARLNSGTLDIWRYSREALVKDAVSDADELLRQVPL